MNVGLGAPRVVRPPANTELPYAIAEPARVPLDHIQLVSTDSALDGWILQSGLKGYGEAIKHFALSVEELAEMTDADVLHIVNTTNMRVISERRLRRALINAGAQVDMNEGGASGGKPEVAREEATIAVPTAVAIQQVGFEQGKWF